MSAPRLAIKILKPTKEVNGCHTLTCILILFNYWHKQSVYAARRCCRQYTMATINAIIFSLSSPTFWADNQTYPPESELLLFCLNPWGDKWLGLGCSSHDWELLSNKINVVSKLIEFIKKCSDWLDLIRLLEHKNLRNVEPTKVKIILHLTFTEATCNF